jgi:hypothetical protein
MPLQHLLGTNSEIFPKRMLKHSILAPHIVRAILKFIHYAIQFFHRVQEFTPEKPSFDEVLRPPKCLIHSQDDFIRSANKLWESSLRWNS